MQLDSKMPTTVEFESSVLKINQSLAKQTARVNMSLCYEAAFKKPLFLKDNSVFDDDLAAFKDESSPNILSTNASSLSSLTIGDDDDDDDDDDDYCDTNVPNGEILIDISSKAQRPILARQWQRNLTNCVQQHESSPKQNICRVESKCDSTKRQTSFYSNRGSCNFHKLNIQSNYVESDNCFRDDRKKLHVQEQIFERENICDCKCCCSTVKGLNCSKQKQELLLTKHKNYQHHDDESNDKIVYEEQLLDQCIRRGMAKITKRNVSDIKPFCWDLHHICLTTRAMRKVSDMKTRSINNCDSVHAQFL